MPAIFGDHMVLQQGVTTPVWGKASPGEKISLTYQGQFEETKADSAGNWRITLRPQSLSKFPGILVINGTNRLEFDDVVRHSGIWHGRRGDHARFLALCGPWPDQRVDQRVDQWASRRPRAGDRQSLGPGRAVR